MLRQQARANRLANLRLRTAVGGLSAVDFQAPRTGCFPSLARTLNHVLAVDMYTWFTAGRRMRCCPAQRSRPRSSMSS